MSGAKESKMPNRMLRQASIHDHFQPLATQIAGHGSGAGEEDVHSGFLKRHRDGKLLKPLQAPPKGTRESGFYQGLFLPAPADLDAVDARFRAIVPAYAGVERLDPADFCDAEEGGFALSDEYLVLEDVTEGYELPNVMDVKIGSRTWGPDASEQKRKQEDAKYAGTKKTLGFSVLGLITHPIRGASDRMTKYDKSFGSKLPTHAAADAPRIFFDVSNSGVIKPLFGIILDKMRAIQRLYEEQRKYHMYASSLLFAYDAAHVRKFLKGEIGEKDLGDKVDVRLIDFAHVFPARGERDENFLGGITSLIATVESVLEES